MDGCAEVSEVAMSLRDVGRLPGMHPRSVHGARTQVPPVRAGRSISHVDHHLVTAGRYSIELVVFTLCKHVPLDQAASGHYSRDAPRLFSNP